MVLSRENSRNVSLPGYFFGLNHAEHFWMEFHASSPRRLEDHPQLVAGFQFAFGFLDEGIPFLEPR